MNIFHVILWTLAVIVYLNIGYMMGMVCVRLDNTKRDVRNPLQTIYFPFGWFMTLFTSGWWNCEIIVDELGEEGYKVLIAVFWPIKILWLFTVIFIIVPMFFCYKGFLIIFGCISFFLIHVFFAPAKKIMKS